MKIKNVHIIIALALASCASREKEVELAMKRYDKYIFMMQADSIAGCFLPSGILSGQGMKVNVGRDSILQFLKSFDTSNITMISNESHSDKIYFKGDTAIQTGNYIQKAALRGDTGVYKGTFTAKWLPDEKGKWKLASMYTIPIK